MNVHKLIKQYGTVESIYENILMISNKGKIQSLLSANKDRVLLNKQLATIKCDVPTNTTLRGIVDPDAFCSMLDYLESELQAYDLANQMGVLLQLIKENER